MNIPIFRAKKLNSDEWVKGSYLFLGNRHQIYLRETPKYMVSTDIDPTTLAIHFSDMLDSEGNKIFASLQEDGKGGDIVNYTIYGYKKCESVSKYKDNQFSYCTNDTTIIGIKK